MEMSRRTALSALAIGAVAIAGKDILSSLDRIIPEEAPKPPKKQEIQRDEVEFSEPHDQTIRWEVGSRLHKDEENDAREIAAFQLEINDFAKKLRQEIGFVPNGSSDASQEQEAARKALLASVLPERIKQIAKILTRYPSTRGQEARLLYEDALQLFSSCHGQGLVFKAWNEALATEGKEVSFDRNGQYYETRMRDYVPASPDIWSQDMDPRNKPNRPEADRQRMQEKPGWSGKQRKKLFKRLSSQPWMIELGKQEDLTLVEYYSFIKSYIHEKSESDEESPRALAERLLEARRTMLERSIVDASTEQVIIFAGNDARYFSGTEDGAWDEVLESSGVNQDRINKIATPEGGSNSETLGMLKKVIASSKGKTLLAFSTHGAEHFLGMGHQGGAEAITDVALAEALLARVQEQHSAETLKDITVIMDACHTYEFAKNVMQKMKEAWQAKQPRPFPFARIQLPCIVAGVQEGSVGQAGSVISRVLQNQLGGIEKDRGISGRRLLQNVQPTSYEENDMTFFSPGTGLEFADNSGHLSQERIV